MVTVEVVNSDIRLRLLSPRTLAFGTRPWAWGGTTVLASSSVNNTTQLHNNRISIDAQGKSLHYSFMRMFQD